MLEFQFATIVEKLTNVLNLLDRDHVKWADD